MQTKTLIIMTLAALSILSSSPLRAQQKESATPAAPDLNQTLRDAADALGILRGPLEQDSILTMELWATGTMYAVGQAFHPDGPWPAFKLTSYHGAISYNPPGAMRVALTRTNPDTPIQGGGGLPLAAPQQQIQVVAGKYAWNEARYGMDATPAMPTAPDRLVQVWITPAGVLKAALQAGSKATVSVERGKVVLNFVMGTMPVKATLDSNNFIERVEARVDDAVLGDTLLEVTYSDYADWNDELYKSDVLSPRRIVQKLGGFPVLDLVISKTDTYNPYVVFPVPAIVEKEAAQQTAAPRVDVQKIAEGVYYLTGGTHHSVAVEFRDYVVLIEAPQSDDRAAAVIETVAKTIPKKPIRYVVNTHHHFDHAAGLRAAVAAGSRIVTQAASKPYFEKVWAAPHTVNPDRLAKSRRTPTIEAVVDKRVFTDGTQTLELHTLQGSQHADTMLVAYLPNPKLLIEADVYTPAPANAPPAPPSREAVNLVENISRLKLDVQQIAPLHGRLVSIDDLRAAVGRAATN